MVVGVEAARVGEHPRQVLAIEDEGGEDRERVPHADPAQVLGNAWNGLEPLAQAREVPRQAARRRRSG